MTISQEFQLGYHDQRGRTLCPPPLSNARDQVGDVADDEDFAGLVSKIVAIGRLSLQRSAGARPAFRQLLPAAALRLEPVGANRCILPEACRTPCGAPFTGAG
jgi:hypothetical protein